MTEYKEQENSYTNSNTSENKEQDKMCENSANKSKKLKARDFKYHMSTSTMENRKKIEEIQATRDKLCKCLDKQFENSAWLVENIKLLCERQETVPMIHEFIFESTEKAVKHNTRILKKYEYNFKKVILGHKGTALNPGSEFRPLKALKQLWENREDWKKIKSILKSGCKYPMGPDVPETTRLEDLKKMASREPIFRNDPLSKRKLLGEGTPSETKKKLSCGRNRLTN